MSDISTRIWLDEGLWDELRRRAIREGVTARELIPRLLGQAAAGAAPARPQPAAPPPAAPSPAPLAALPVDGGPPVVPMAEVYRCGVCGAEIRLGAVSQHINRHLKETQAAEAARS